MARVPGHSITSSFFRIWKWLKTTIGNQSTHHYSLGIETNKQTKKTENAETKCKEVDEENATLKNANTREQRTLQWSMLNMSKAQNSQVNAVWTAHCHWAFGKCSSSRTAKSLFAKAWTIIYIFEGEHGAEVQWAKVAGLGRGGGGGFTCFLHGGKSTCPEAQCGGSAPGSPGDRRMSRRHTWVTAHCAYTPYKASWMSPCHTESTNHNNDRHMLGQSHRWRWDFFNQKSIWNVFIQLIYETVFSKV